MIVKSEIRMLEGSVIRIENIFEYFFGDGMHCELSDVLVLVLEFREML